MGYRMAGKKQAAHRSAASAVTRGEPGPCHALPKALAMGDSADGAGRIIVPVGQRAAIGPTAADATFFQSLRVQLLLSSDKISDPYSQHPWVYACVRQIADSLSACPFNIWRGDRSDKDMQDEPTSADGVEWVDLFTQPNEFMTRQQLWEATSVHLDTTGESFWLLLNANGDLVNEGEKPTEIFPFPGNKFRHDVDQDSKRVARWWFEGRDRQEEVLPFQLIHYKLTDPRQPYRGLPPLSAAFLSVRQDFKASLFNEAFFSNGAEPGGIIHAEADITDPLEVKKMIDEHNARHQGVLNASRVKFFGPGMKYEWAPTRHRDMEFIKLREETRREVLAVFGLTEHDVGIIENSNRATALTAERRFYTKVIIPRSKLIEDTLWSWMKEFDNGQYFGEFDFMHVDGLREGLGETIDQVSRLFEIGFATRNELNERFDLGFENDPDGDVRLVPAGYTPVEAANDPPASVDAPQDEEAEELAAAALHYASAAETPKRARMTWKFFLDELFGPFEIKVFRKVISHISALRRETLRKYDAATKSIPSHLPPFTTTPNHSDSLKAGIEFADIERVLFDPVAADARLVARLRPLFEAISGRTTVLLSQELGTLNNFGVTIPEMVAFLDAKANKVTGINQTVRKQLVEELIDGVRAGDNVTALRQRITRRFKISSGRAGTIARTETSQVVNGTRQLAFRKEGVEATEWISSQDAVVRDSHRISGQVRRLGERFTNGLRFPCDPDGPVEEIVNCRCVAIPADAVDPE